MFPDGTFIFKAWEVFPAITCLKKGGKVFSHHQPTISSIPSGKLGYPLESQ